MCKLRWQKPACRIEEYLKLCKETEEKFKCKNRELDRVQSAGAKIEIKTCSEMFERS